MNSADPEKMTRGTKLFVSAFTVVAPFIMWLAGGLTDNPSFW